MSYCKSYQANQVKSGKKSLKIKSANIIANAFTAFLKGYQTIEEDMPKYISGSPLSFSISDSIINSPSLAVNLSDLLRYKNVFIHVKDSMTQSGQV